MSKLKFTAADHLFRRLLKELRQESGLTQQEIADRLSRPQSYVSKYELGERRLDFIETAEICESIGITIVDFARLYSEQISKASRTKRR